MQGLNPKAARQTTEGGVFTLAGQIFHPELLPCHPELLPCHPELLPCHPERSRRTFWCLLRSFGFAQDDIMGDSG